MKYYLRLTVRLQAAMGPHAPRRMLDQFEVLTQKRRLVCHADGASLTMQPHGNNIRGILESSLPYCNLAYVTPKLENEIPDGVVSRPS